MDDHVQCTICLDPFKYPVTIPCGHTFCKACISKFWDRKDRDFHCPFCKKNFDTRPELNRNVSLSMITEISTHSPVKMDVSAGASVHTDPDPEPEQICERHQKPLVIYCRNDSMCVCYECSVNECKGHDKILVVEERKNREVSLQQTARWVNTKFSLLIKDSRFMEVPRFSDVPVDVHVSVQEKLTPVTDVLSRMSKLVCEDLERAVQVSAGQDKEGRERSWIVFSVFLVGSPQDKRPVLAVVPSPATPSYPAEREGLNAYHCNLTFDPRTANAHLRLSQSNRRAEHMISGPRPVLADESRFDHTWQVLCFQSFTHGQHYWELEVSKPWAYVGVTYPNIPRKEKGKRCMVGMNELSWSLQLDERQLTAWHAGCKESVAGQLQQNAQPLRIGMLLDYEAGTLTYYGEGQVRLHAFHCAFTQALLPACWIGEGVTITLCEPRA
ncbi:hypothetical protein cypCar_00030668 [Cyprinus carpio]|nr:hypothetical protein cypCar_00030668 [Cyprinus carpio]